MATRVVTVNDVLDGHVGLDLECFDRIYLNGWVANLQVPGQVVSFLARHLGFPIPSPAILERIGLGFRKAVTDFAAEHDIPVVRFLKGQRKVEVMRPYLERLERQGRTGVAAIGVAQEFRRVFTGTTHHADEGGGDVPRFSYAKADRRVTAYYFYVVDEAFGPAGSRPWSMTPDLGLLRGLTHLEEFFHKARDVNRRMVDAFRVGQGCVLASPAFARVARPTISDARRASALRFGDPRVMALAGALCAVVHTITGFTNRSLRAQVATLLGEPYSSNQMSYDLRRLRLKGLITRLPHTTTYVLTPRGTASRDLLHQSVHDRLLRTLLAANAPPAPLSLRQALRVIDHHVDDYINKARLAA